MAFKSEFILFFILFRLFSAEAQSAIVSSGNYDLTNGNSLSWSLGEIITETFSQSAYTLTQGFQQSYKSTVGQEKLVLDAAIDLFPNPFFSNLTIHLPEKAEHIRIIIYDNNSRIIAKENYSPTFSDNIVTVKMNDLSPGIYFISIAYSDQQFMKQIIKL